MRVTSVSLPARLEIPPAVLAIATRLQEAGFDTWCVGGAVRDALMGSPQSDFDLATAATPDQVQQLFKRTVPVGVEFGTVGVFGDDRVLHEVTTFRHDVSTDGRRAVVKWGATIDEDLARRDFTINAIAYHPLRHEWRDPFHGADDLPTATIRAVGKAEERFREDYLRILRGARFAARFQSCIDKGTWEAMVAEAPGMARLSAERVREEWFKTLRTARSLVWALKLWRPLVRHTSWMPELIAGDPPEPPEGMHRDPIELTILVTEGDGAAPLLARLKCSNQDLGRAEGMIRGPAAPAGDPTDPRTVRRWMAEVNTAEEDLLDLWRLRHGVEAPWAPTVAAIRARGEATGRGQLAVTGDDLLKAGVPKGPEIGATLDRLLALVLDDPALNTRDALLARARETT